MRATVCEAFDSPEQLVVKEVDTPTPTGKQVLLKIEAAGIGFADALTVAGRYQIRPPLPFIPGNEVAGLVEQTGPDAKQLRQGQRVLASVANGGLAQYAAVEESRCVPIPDALSTDAAAAFLVNYCTAWHGLIDCGSLKDKETVLVLGASGGVGLAAIDVAKAMGGHVIAAASTQQKRDACLAAGADAAIDYSNKDWRDALKEVLGSRPLNLVYDPVGGDFAEPALRSLSPGGRFLVVGFAAGDIPRLPANLPLLKRCAIVGVNWGGHIAENPSETGRVIKALLEWVAAGRLHPAAGESFPLQESAAAMAKIFNRQAIGKIVIHPWD